MLSIDDFIPVTLETKKDFDQVYSKYPPVHSDYVFTTLVSWSDYAHYSYVLVDDAIIIKTCIDDMVYFRPPLGKYSKETFDELIKLAKKEGSGRPLTMITEGVKQWIEKEYPISSFHPHPEFADYVYKSSDLATLEGSKYRKIRNRLNKFKKHFDYQVVTVSLENMDEVKRFLKRWCIWRECEDDPLLSYEKNAVMYSMNNIEELGLSGIAIRVNDHIEAISIFEQMNKETVVVHFEKGSPYYDGIYKAVNMETARIVQKDALYINRESDMGNPGLRKAKESYRPDHMIPVYHLEKEDIYSN